MNNQIKGAILDGGDGKVKRKLKGLLLVASALIPPVCGCPAFADTGHIRKAKPSVTLQSSARLATVIVTAQKSTESLAKTPAQIMVLNSSELSAAGVSDLRSLGSTLPSVRVNTESFVAQLFVRGVGDGLDVPYITPAVGIEENGIYIPRYAGATGLFDINQVEVLPGPQGTLYGRAAIGGVVAITTRRPTQHFEVHLMDEGGNYGAQHISGVLNAPVNDKVSARLAVDYNYQAGYNSNGTDARNSVGTRLSLLAKPNSDVTIFLWGLYYQDHARTSPLLSVPGIGNPRDLPAFNSGTAFFYPPNGYPNNLTDDTFRTAQFGAQVDATLGPVTVTYLPGYIWNFENGLRNLLGFPRAIHTGGSQYSNELRFSNTHKGKLNWLIGLYQFHNSNPFAYTAGKVVVPFGNVVEGSGPFLAGADLTSKDTLYAAFGQVTYSLTDVLRITAGGRYSSEKLQANNAKLYYPIRPTFARGTQTFNYSDSWHHLDWKVGLQANVGASSILYVNVQTGFNPGTFELNPNAPALAGNHLRAERMLGFTVGSKSRFLDDRAEANLELYYYRYTDQLINALSGQASALLTYNVPRSRIYGAQLDTAFAVTSRTEINFKVGYLQANIINFNNGSVNYSGYRLEYSPVWSLIGGLTHSFPLASGASVKFRADTVYSSGYYADISLTPDLHQGAFTETNLNLMYYPPSGTFDIGAYVRNLENDTIIAAAAATGHPHPFGGVAFLQAPRTFGIRGDVYFY